MLSAAECVGDGHRENAKSGACGAYQMTDDPRFFRPCLGVDFFQFNHHMNSLSDLRLPLHHNLVTFVAVPLLLLADLRTNAQNP